ncbi:MAG: hypothetical protein QOD41_3746, partial [Cryptosporangiaceae bacterium]|nr:hypothetical protein [Cryptosporangiaceae bacterium]
MNPPVQFGVLGSLAVWRDGELVTPRSATHRAVLAVLLLAEGSALAPERIVELVSSGEPPKNPRLWVQVAVSRLRAWLADVSGGSATVRFSGTGYRLVAPAGSVDLERFRQLYAAGRAESRVDLLTQALRLWRGPVLSEGPAALRDSGIAAAIDRLRLDAACALAETAIASGTPDPAVAILDELVREHPLDERLNAWWALVLAGCGRQADALRAIETARNRLADELGVDPGEHLRQAQLRVLRQDVLPSAPAPRPPAARAWRGPRGQISEVIGRETQERELAALLAERRLVSIIGPGGAGKTTVALHIAGELAGDYPDGVAVLVLTPFTSADEIMMALGSLMDVTAPTAEQIRHTLGLALQSRRMLLVLDNCEHVAEAGAGIVRWLLAAAPELTVLATSRQPLLVTGEVAWALGPLAVPGEGDAADPETAAVALFLRRAKEALPSFALGDGDLGRIGRLCRRLDGLPLALELAAARVRALTVTQIADRLDIGYGLLEGAGAGREQRHHTLRSTLDWSYELLDGPERTLLARLSVFRGGCTVETAEAICSVEPLTRDQVLPTLVALVDKSLVQPYDADGERRFRLLETVSEFAAERLDAGEAAAVADRGLDHWLDRARTIDSWAAYNERAQACRDLSSDIGNVRAAITHGYSSGRIADTAE